MTYKSRPLHVRPPMHANASTGVTLVAAAPVTITHHAEKFAFPALVTARCRRTWTPGADNASRSIELRRERTVPFRDESILRAFECWYILFFCCTWSRYDGHIHCTDTGGESSELAVFEMFAGSKRRNEQQRSCTYHAAAASITHVFGTNPD